MAACRWVYDDELPMGKFMVPGCWNRALNGEDAECHCKEIRAPTMQEQIDTLQQELAKVREALAMSTAIKEVMKDE